MSQVRIPQAGIFERTIHHTGWGNDDIVSYSRSTFPSIPSSATSPVTFYSLANFLVGTLLGLTGALWM